jgi:hypothetical protein
MTYTAYGLFPASAVLSLADASQPVAEVIGVYDTRQDAEDACIRARQNYTLSHGNQATRQTWVSKGTLDSATAYALLLARQTLELPDTRVPCRAWVQKYMEGEMTDWYIQDDRGTTRYASWPGLRAAMGRLAPIDEWRLQQS